MTSEGRNTILRTPKLVHEGDSTTKVASKAQEGG
eukprot:CAMPEP_0174296630 /NCGR_PEP_ID=MMETSP0809-20121228/48437_1 /TAXON_ID=73025 ORGANISM="Eutreptiella gymnastica-like, Strain CCMP1594" /NCGR_SAMPLE_ID=MMETSP0809 /ASSEMBLY_ACC=CAM_ASM_000658 /LENGTH=33 /DNA_ID= /DNA_START= /DNA_END= /DNA_ORIENTATION=